MTVLFLKLHDLLKVLGMNEALLITRTKYDIVSRTIELEPIYKDYKTSAGYVYNTY